MVPKIMDFDDFGGSLPRLEREPVRADGLAREGILHIGTMMPGTRHHDAR